MLLMKSTPKGVVFFKIVHPSMKAARMNAELQLLALPFSFMQYRGESSTPLKS